MDDLIATLPDPKKDKMPPRVGFSEEGYKQAIEDNKRKSLYLNPKTDTEKKVKYVLKSLIGADLAKDGDWITVVGGREVWQKKVADYSGGIPYGGGVLALYVEVKGISPGKNFQLARLDKRNNPKQPSQHEKLTKAHKLGYLTWLALGFWDAKHFAKPVMEERKGRKYTKWIRGELRLTIYLIDWGIWLNLLSELKGRSLKQKDRAMMEDMSIYKVNRWTIHHNHWLLNLPLRIRGHRQLNHS